MGKINAFCAGIDVGKRFLLCCALTGAAGEEPRSQTRRFTIVLANPEEVKNRKGHKTDRNDAEHLADILRHDHIRASYIPPKPIRDLRDLTRRRLQLTKDASRERNRIEKLLACLGAALNLKARNGVFRRRILGSLSITRTVRRGI